VIEGAQDRPPVEETRAYRPLVIGLALLLTIVSLALIWPYVRSAGRPGTAQVGALAPEIRLAQLQAGKPADRASLSSLAGHPVLVNFWATWCVPCKEEFPTIEAKYLQYRDSQQLVVIGINAQSDAGPGAAQQFVKELGATFPVWLDVDASAEQAYRVDALPTSILIDRQGVIRDIVVGGPMTAEQLDRELRKIF